MVKVTQSVSGGGFKCGLIPEIRLLTSRLNSEKGETGYPVFSFFRPLRMQGPLYTQMGPKKCAKN